VAENHVPALGTPRDQGNAAVAAGVEGPGVTGGGYQDSQGRGSTIVDVSTRSDEAAQRQIDRTIERRAREVDARAEREALWRESHSRFEHARHRRLVAEWFTHFCRMAERHRALSEDYERRAEALCEERNMA
jgi:hypothetical protein